MGEPEKTKARALADGVPVYCAYDKLVLLDELQENPRNPNRHPDTQILLLAKIIRDQGWRAPITVSSRSGLIVRGHGRLAAAKKGGWKVAPVDFQHYDSETEEWADLVADNRLSELSEIDNKLLLDMLQEIDTGEVDILLTGFTDEDMENLIASFETGSGDPGGSGGEDDLPPVPEKDPETKPGDLWILGRHRLLCGDTTNPADVRRVMNTERAAMVHTDPPYGVNYAGGMKEWDVIKNDELGKERLLHDLLLPSFRNMVEVTVDKGAFYIWHSTSTREEFMLAMKLAGLMESQTIIWVKNNFAAGFQDYRGMHEPCFYASKAGEKAEFYGDRAEPNVWRATLKTTTGTSCTLGQGIVLVDDKGRKIFITPKLGKGKKVRYIHLQAGDTCEVLTDPLSADVWEVDKATQIEHPNQKPVELARRAIANSSQVGEIILDGFLGSGTTLIAAHLTGRQCYGIEIDPKNCDIIVARWERVSGERAERFNAEGAPYEIDENEPSE